ncbi:DUF4377 domain-containing protein [Polyangium sorediatum]|uniref:DUF4377 domain-containing protein n=1 Tax=Polyangium sorediatum TaxID=889274 RepID=A0ABT6NMD4_9BACT|nr:DUF4377 domain-containing protein [Polyangium sorediatum]MDI1429377.1 DUF4377 domain-containing protein [Polyangium sorediatum]
MVSASRQALVTLVLFAAACAPSETQSSTTVPVGTPEEAKPDAPPDTSKATEESPAKDGETTLFVHAERVDCMGVGPMRCMQVREAENKEWERFYDRIEGFSYEEGYAYELRVKREPVANPPADGSSERTLLVKIVSKKKP